MHAADTAAYKNIVEWLGGGSRSAFFEAYPGFSAETWLFCGR